LAETTATATRPATLEDVADRIRARLGDSPRRLWVILPSTQLIRELEQILLDRGQACVGVSLLTVDLAYEQILLARGLPSREPLSHRVLQSLLARQLGALRGRPTGADEELEYLLRFPSTVRGLLDVLDECREYGMDRAGGTQEVPSAMGRLTLTLLAGQRRLLDSASGANDRFARAAAALELGDDALPSHPVLVFWPGSRPRGSLLRLTSALPDVTWLEREVECNGTGIRSRAKSLFQTGEAPQPVAAGSFAMFSAQGNEEELREALQRARDLIVAGCPPHRIAIVLTDSRAYEPFVSAIAREEGVPLASWLAPRLSREPLCAFALDLLRLVADELPRDVLIRCLTSPFLRHEGFAGPVSGVLSTESIARLDRVTRERMCVGGFERIPATLEQEPSPRSRALVPGLLAIASGFRAAHDALAGAGTSAEQASVLDELFDALLSPRDERNEIIRERVLACTRRLAEWSRVGCGPIAVHDLVDVLSDLADEQLTEPKDFHPEGVRVLPLHRVRGLGFDHVFLLGVDRDRLPARAGGDPYLSEADRLVLRQHVANTVDTPAGYLPPLRLAAEEETIQREDLEALVGAARESLTLSTQRADASGREKSPSLWLRHFGRALAGSERVHEIMKSHWFRAEPWSPPERLRARYDKDRPLSLSEALALGGFEGGPDGLAQLAADIGGVDLGRSCEFLTIKDSFAPRQDGGFRFDAVRLADAVDGDESMSVSQFEMLGSCPLKFFFRHRLRVRALADEPRIDRVSRMAIGIALHGMLHEVLVEVEKAGLFQPGASEQEALALAQKLVRKAVGELRDPLLSELCRQLPLLEHQFVEMWSEGLAEILRLDFEDAWQQGLLPKQFEQDVSGEFEIGGERVAARVLRLHGRVDRLDEAPGTLRIIDYKSGGWFSREVKEIGVQLLKGRQLQLVLYALMLADRVRSKQNLIAELRGVTPEQLASAGGQLPRKPLGRKVWQHEAGLLETIAVIDELGKSGTFPPRKGFQCQWCEYRAACPRHHKPTEQRLATLTELDDWRLLSEKSTKAAKIADVLGEQGDG